MPSSLSILAAFMHSSLSTPAAVQINSPATGISSFTDEQEVNSKKTNKENRFIVLFLGPFFHEQI